jgi:hypothetical protein
MAGVEESYRHTSTAWPINGAITQQTYIMAHAWDMHQRVTRLLYNHG